MWKPFLIVLSLQVYAPERELSQILSWQIDYKNVSTELCLIGAHYDTDKSSQRKNISAGSYWSIIEFTSQKIDSKTPGSMSIGACLLSLLNEMSALYPPCLIDLGTK